MAESAHGAEEAGSEPDSLPLWNLADLYEAMDAPEVERDLARAAEQSQAFQQAYKGKLRQIAEGVDGGGRLAAAIAEYEGIEEVMGRLGSYGSLVYAGDTADPVRAKFYGDLQDRLTTISTDLLFFPLELNRLEDDLVENALRSEALSAYRPWIEDLRLERPYQLDDTIERLFHEKHVTGRGAWNRLFDETLAGLRFRIDGELLPLEPHPERTGQPGGDAPQGGRRGTLGDVQRESAPFHPHHQCARQGQVDLGCLAWLQGCWSLQALGEPR